MSFSFLCGSLSRPTLPVLKWGRPEIIVEPQELDLYRAAHPELTYHVLPESGRGFSYMMNAMTRVCLEQGNRYFIFTDDDVYGIRARNCLPEKFSKVTPEVSPSVLDRLVCIADHNNMAQLNLSFAASSWGATKEYQDPAGAWGVYICDARAVKAVGGFDESLAIFADWDMSAKLIRSGYRCVKTNLVSFEHKMKGMAGGAEQIYKDQDRIKAAAETLIQRFGSSVARMEWIENHNQWEVRFNWRKLLPR